ncbi:MAG: peptidylprolyl isomerase [Candidatus Woesearchaeota archaeon]
MKEKIKKGDFVEIEFTGTIKETGVVFDTTSEEVAKKEGIYNPKHKYGPVVVCVGQNQLLKGLDEFVEGKEIGVEYEVLVQPQDGFGKKDAKNIKLIPTKLFTKQKISPVPGMPVNIDGVYGIIVTTTGGRTIVDFNHPLAGKELIYRFKTNKIIKDPSEKILSFINTELGIKKEDTEVNIKDGEAEIKLKINIPEEVKEIIKKRITEIIPEIKKVSFVNKEQQK